MALRDIWVPGGKDWLPTVSRQSLTRNYPRPKCLLKHLHTCIFPLRQGSKFKADFREGDMTKHFSVKKKGFLFVKRGEAIQWMRGFGKDFYRKGNSVNRRTLRIEKLLSSSPSQNSAHLSPPSLNDPTAGVNTQYLSGKNCLGGTACLAGFRCLLWGLWVALSPKSFPGNSSGNPFTLDSAPHRRRMFGQEVEEPLPILVSRVLHKLQLHKLPVV